MRVRALLDFAGDFGPGLPVMDYKQGQEFEAPEVVGDLWSDRKLVEPVAPVIEAMAPVEARREPTPAAPKPVPVPKKAAPKKRAAKRTKGK